jgi:hypothetical protein
MIYKAEDEIDVSRIFKTDGGTYEVSSAEELVSQMRESSFLEYSSDAEFMTAKASVAREVTGQTIRSDNPKNFVEDLIRFGLMTEEGEMK